MVVDDRFLAAFLDQTLAMGYGLVASIILISIHGMDPRRAIPSILLSQLLLAVPVTLSLGKVRLRFALKAFLALTTCLSLVLPSLLKALDRNEVTILYSVALISVALLYYVRRRISLRMRYWVVLFSVLAAIGKAVVGGGLSAIFVAMQTMLGTNVREALLSLPALKALPVATTLLGYIVAGLYPSWLGSAIMTLGALGGTFLARKTLKRVKADERLAIAFLLLGSIIALLHNLY